ncbi:MAG: hypothetical protein WD894_19445 [Pirellulales bacterium]
MQPQDILEVLREDPFVPFAVHMSNGSSYEVRHPAMAIVERSKMLVSLPAERSPDEPADKTVRLSLSHINRLEPIGPAGKGRRTRRSS